MIKYTSNYFRSNLPLEKRKMDSLLMRFIYRPISFYTASWAHYINLNANQVSVLSTILAVLIAVLFILHIWSLEIIGAILLSVWMVLDCTDGNMARCIEKMPYGEFLDAISGYFAIDLSVMAIGFAAFFQKGVLFDKGNVWIVLAGALAGLSDALSRLAFQKFLNVQSEEEKIIKNNYVNRNGFLYRVHKRIDTEVGLNGLFLPAIIICAIFRCLDVFTLFYSLFYVFNFIITIAILIKKTKIDYQ